jgi:RHS repeat-associated protein
VIIREVVNSSGNLTSRYDYTMWGEPELISGSFDLDFKYTSHYHHQKSGLHLAPFRAYDVKTARWISRDPIEEAGGVNLYGYVGNESISYFDPIGADRHRAILAALLGLVAPAKEMQKGNFAVEMEGEDRERPKIEKCNDSSKKSSGSAGGGKKKKWQRSKGYKKLGGAGAGIGAALALNRLTQADLEAIAAHSERYIRTGNDSDFVAATSAVANVDSIAGTAFFTALEDARRNFTEACP